jgi:hypothetical protein
MSAIDPLSQTNRESTSALQDMDRCPTCEQTIPPEKVALVKGRLVAHEHRLTRDLTARLEADFARSRSRKRSSDIKKPRVFSVLN